MITAIEMLEKHGINTEKLGIEAEYSFKNILNAMEEYRKDHSSGGYLDALLDAIQRKLKEFEDNEDRLVYMDKLIEGYCRFCGRGDGDSKIKCQCWNDE